MARPSLHAKRGLGGPWRPSRHQDHDGRPPARFPHSSASHSASSSPVHAESESPSCHKRVPSPPSFLRRHQTGLRPSSKVFFQALYCPQERRTEQAHHRPFSPQQAPEGSYIQDGAGAGHRLLHTFPDVGLHGGPRGCVLPCSHRLDLPPPAGLRCRRHDLRLSNASVWPVGGPMGVCQGDKTHQGSHAPPLSPFSYIPGRFPPSRSFRSISPGSHPVSTRPPRAPRPSCPQPEIPSDTFPTGAVSGGRFPFGHPSPVSPRGQDRVHRVPVPVSDTFSEPFEASSGTSGGSSQFCCSLRSAREAETPPSRGVDELPHYSFSERLTSSSRPDPERAPGTLDRPFSAEVSSSYDDPSSVPGTHDGRLSLGLGSDSFTAHHFRFLASLLSLSFHQLARTSGRVPLPSRIPGHPSRQLCVADVRQHDGGLMSPQARLSPFRGPHGAYDLHHGVLPLPWHPSGPEAPERLTQRPCGPGISRGPDLHRVVLGQSHLPMGQLSLTSISSGSFCDETQPSAPLVRFPLPGSCGSGRQCVGGAMVPLGFHLPVSTFPAPPQSLLPHSPLPRSRSPHRSILCSIRLHSQPSPPVSRAHSSSTRPFLVADDQGRPSLPPRPFGLSSSRVETIKQGLRSAGYTSAAADIFLLQHRLSTTRQYQSIWKKFMDFVFSQNIPHHNISVATVCNFLAHVATVDRLAYRTLTGYRSALRVPLQWGCGFDVVTPETDQFLRGLFHFKPPPVAAPMPDWDLNILLSYLNSPKFEPLSSASPRCLVQKTLCLLLLSSGRRIGEIANLSRSHSLSRSGHLLHLSWLHGFKPKHHSASFQSPTPSIFFMDPSMPDVFPLCPVRAFTTFLRISDSWSVHDGTTNLQEHLWILPSLASLSQDRLSNLFRSLVKSALSNSGLHSNKIYPHQMRKLSASHALAVGQDIDLVRTNMGFSSEFILRKNYVARVPTLTHACSLPGGPFFPPGSHTLSSSDSD